jgi:hypothetical protein
MPTPADCLEALLYVACDPDSRDEDGRVTPEAQALMDRIAAAARDPESLHALLGADVDDDDGPAQYARPTPEPTRTRKRIVRDANGFIAEIIEETIP